MKLLTSIDVKSKWNVKQAGVENKAKFHLLSKASTLLVTLELIKLRSATPQILLYASPARPQWHPKPVCSPPSSSASGCFSKKPNVNPNMLHRGADGERRVMCQSVSDTSQI